MQGSSRTKLRPSLQAQQPVRPPSASSSPAGGEGAATSARSAQRKHLSRPSPARRVPLPTITEHPAEEARASGRPVSLRAVAVFTPASAPPAPRTLAQNAALLRLDPKQLPSVAPAHLGSDVVSALVEGCGPHLPGMTPAQIAHALLGPPSDRKHPSLSPEAALARRIVSPEGLPAADPSNEARDFILARRAELLGLLYGRMDKVKARVDEDTRLRDHRSLPAAEPALGQAVALRALAFAKLYAVFPRGLLMTLARELVAQGNGARPGRSESQQAAAARLLQAARRALDTQLTEAQRQQLPPRWSEPAQG